MTPNTSEWWQNQWDQYKRDLNSTGQRANKLQEENTNLSAQLNQLLTDASMIDQQNKQLQDELAQAQKQIPLLISKRDEVIILLDQHAEMIGKQNGTIRNLKEELSTNTKALEEANAKLKTYEQNK